MLMETNQKKHINTPYRIRFTKYGDERGWLVVMEGKTDIPFSIARVFYIYGSEPGVVRGRHANRRSEFVLINVCGNCKVKTDDGLGNQDIFILEHPHEGVYIPRMVWKDMYDFSEDSILLCLASEAYDNSEYIRDYQVFVKEMEEQGHGS